ncbi:MAG: hypothetical protein IJD24_06395 [Agathobacter sp.]|nr:hypothetical protein [Agathobacter sp.]
MEARKEQVIVGIDLNDRYAMISYYQLNMREPETVSPIAGSEIYQIPTLLAKRKYLGQWYYGADAKKMAKTSEVICVDSLLKRAVNGESIRVEDETYEAWELLALFLKKVMELPQKLGNVRNCDKLVLSVERLSKENMEVFWKIAPKLGLLPEQFMVIDHKESFYYFALNQPESLWIHDVFLFENDGKNLFYYGLKRNTRTTPQVISIKESIKVPIDDEENKDQAFLQLIQRGFENQIVSTAYLVGDGFEGGWMKDSLTYLCRGRRAFMGNNLYCKGACYAGYVRACVENWKYIYMGENEMKFNLSLKVRDRGELAFYNLISAGKNWFESKGECEVILSGVEGIDFWKQLPNSREAVIETLELTDLPSRPDRTTRLRITATPVSDEKIEVQIRDLGFGEIYRSTDKTWKYTMTM